MAITSTGEALLWEWYEPDSQWQWISRVPLYVAPSPSLSGTSGTGNSIYYLHTLDTKRKVKDAVFWSQLNLIIWCTEENGNKKRVFAREVTFEVVPPAKQKKRYINVNLGNFRELMAMSDAKNFYWGKEGIWVHSDKVTT
jgi:hypothetical protein